MKSPRARLLESTGKFAIVGIVNNIVGYTIFAVLSLLGTPAIPAMAVSYGTGMIISFFGNRSFTFKHQGKSGPAILRFLVVNAAGFTLNAALLWLFVDVARFPQLLVQLFAIACVATLTYTLMRVWVFHESKVQPEASNA